MRRCAISKRVELALDQCGRLELFEPELRVSVNRSTQLDDARGQRFVYFDCHCKRFLSDRYFRSRRRNRCAGMMTADLAFAMLINRTSAFYQANPPLYMTYVEHTRVSAPSLGRAQDIDRSITVRVADNFAVMKDLPNGGWRAGEAFPIVAYFDPISNFKFSYFANLKRVDITLDRGAPFFLAIPAADPASTSSCRITVIGPPDTRATRPTRRCIF